MAGPANETAVQGLWKKAVDIIESLRSHIDGTQVADSTGRIPLLEDALEGEHTVAPLANAAASMRSSLSALISPAVVRSFLNPIILEYGKVISTDSTKLDRFGGGYRSPEAVLEVMYEFFVAQSPHTKIESRGISFGTITYDTSNNVGAGKLRRLTVDEYGYEIEACQVEQKTFRCRADANSGADEEAEVFEVLGQQPSKDWTRQGVAGNGSGLRVNTSIVNKHAGSGGGGSLLTNGSFTSYNSAGTTDKFTGWTKSGTAANGVYTQSTEFYRSHPQEGDTPYSLQLDVTGGLTFTLKQTLENMNVDALRRDRPYFYRVMVKSPAADATGGAFHIRLGSQGAAGSATISDPTSLGTGWTEVFIPLDANCWFANFNQDTLDVEIEWAGGTGGTILVDDGIFCEMDLIDGTYWILTQNQGTPTRWLIDDNLYVEDSLDGTFGDGKLQYYLWLGYGRYLPHSTTPTITDP